MLNRSTSFIGLAISATALSSCGSSNNAIAPLPLFPQSGFVYPPGGGGFPSPYSSCTGATHANAQGVQVCQVSSSTNASITYFGTPMTETWGGSTQVYWNSFPYQGSAVALPNSYQQETYLYPGEQFTMSATGYWSPNPHYTLFSNTCPDDDSLTSPKGTLEFYAGGQTLTTGPTGSGTATTGGILMLELQGDSNSQGCLSINYNLTITRCQDIYGNPASC